MRRVPSILFMAVLLLAWPMAATTGAGQATRTAQGAEPRLRADFNGDGAADLATGRRAKAWAPVRAPPGWRTCCIGSAAGLTGTGSQLWSPRHPWSHWRRRGGRWL